MISDPGCSCSYCVAVQTSQTSDLRSSCFHSSPLERSALSVRHAQSGYKRAKNRSNFIKDPRHHPTRLEGASDRIVRAQITAIALATIAIVAALFHFAPTT
jgi:hypothetical protein